MEAEDEVAEDAGPEADEVDTGRVGNSDGSGTKRFDCEMRLFEERLDNSSSRTCHDYQSNT